MGDPDLDLRLARFLQDQEDNPIQETLKTIADNQLEHEKKDNDRHVEVKLLVEGHSGRLTALEQRTARLEDREEDTATRDRRTLELAARAEGIALGKRTPRSDPPFLGLVAKTIRSKAAHIVGVALLSLIAGWLTRHLGVGAPRAAAAAPAAAASSR